MNVYIVKYSIADIVSSTLEIRADDIEDAEYNAYEMIDHLHDLKYRADQELVSIDGIIPKESL